MASTPGGDGVEIKRPDGSVTRVHLAWQRLPRCSGRSLLLTCLSCGKSALDRDRLEVICDHLAVRKAETGEFAPYEALRSEMLELGRACVARKHRESAVLMLL